MFQPVFCPKGPDTPKKRGLKHLPLFTQRQVRAQSGQNLHFHVEARYSNGGDYGR